MRSHTCPKRVPQIAYFTGHCNRGLTTRIGTRETQVPVFHVKEFVQREVVFIPIWCVRYFQVITVGNYKLTKMA